MKTEEKEAFIRKKAVENVSDPTKGKILWFGHAISKLQSESLQRKEVESALSNCEVIEDYPWLTRRLSIRTKLSSSAYHEGHEKEAYRLGFSAAFARFVALREKWGLILSTYLPDCLVLAFISNGRSLHSVVALDQANDRIFVVTVYRPDKERWENDWKNQKLDFCSKVFCVLGVDKRRGSL